jgi:hypothetical protein
MMRYPSGPATKALLLGVLTLGLAAGSAQAGPGGGLRPAAPFAGGIIQLSTTTMTFDAPLNGPNPPPQKLILKNIDTQALQWKTAITTDSGGNWLTVSPRKGHRGAGQSKAVSVAVAMTTLGAGTYTGHVTFSLKNGSGPVVLTVTLHVLDKPFIDVEPSTGLTFYAPVNSGLQPTQTLTLSNLGGQPLNWSRTFDTTPTGGGWLKTVTPASGTLTKGAFIPLTVTVDATGLGVGTYNGFVNVTGNATNVPPPISTPITLIVTSSPVLIVSPGELDFNAPFGSPDPAPQTVSITNGGGSPLNWTLTDPPPGPASWLTFTPASATGIPAGGTQPAAFQVSVSAAGLAEGVYTETLVLSSNATVGVLDGVSGTTPLSITVVLSVSKSPVMDVEPPTLTFNAPLGGPDPDIQHITVANQGGGLLSWKATINGAPWLSLNKLSNIVASGDPGVAGGAFDDLQAIVSVSSIATAGTYSGSIDFDDTTGTGNIITIFVTLVVSDAPVMQVSPTSLLFDVPAGGGALVSQTVTLQNVGSGPLNLVWTATPTPAASWLGVSPSGGTLTAGSSIDLTVTVDPSTLSLGTVVGSITINATDGTNPVANSPLVISVVVNANAAPKIQLTPSSIVVDVAHSGAAVQQTVTLQNVGSGADMQFSAAGNGSWLTVSPTTGTPIVSGGSISLTLTITPGSSAIGTYSGLMTVTSSNASNVSQTVFVTMNVTDNPKIDLTPASLVFNLPVNGAAASQSVTLKNVGGGPNALAYTTSVPAAAAAWLAAAPPSGTVIAGSFTTLTITATPGATAGTFTSTVKVDSTNAENAPQFISVTMNLTASPRIGLSSGDLTFTTGVGVNPGSQPVTVTNTGGGSMLWGVGSSMSTPPAGTWLSLSGSPGSTLTSGNSDTFNVDITVGALPAGTYTGLVTVTAGTATNNPQSFKVTLNILAGPAIGVSQPSLTFTTPAGTPPAVQPITVSNAGGTDLDWSASAIVTTPAGGNWLQFSPSSPSDTGVHAGNSSAAFNVTPDITGLAPGTYSGTVRITGGAGTVNSPVDIPVTLKIESQPIIGLSPAALVFTVTLGDANPTNQQVTVTNLGDLTLNWTATSSVSTPVAGTWLGLSGTLSGSLTGGVSGPPFDVTVDLTNLAAGTYTGSVTVSDPAATNNPQTIGVTLIINTPAGTIKIPKAGYCGSVGFDVAFPLILLWAFRKWRGGRRAMGTSVSLLLVLVFSLSGGASARADEEFDLPRSLAQEEKAPERPTAMPTPAQEGKPGEEFFDFAAGILNLHIGVVDFSSDFHAKAEVCGGLGVRIPSPFLSTLFGHERDRVGFLVDVTGSGISRDITGIQDKSGTLIFATAGLYGTFVRTESFEAQVEVAAQYGYFGGVTNLTNGFAALVGLRGALQLGDGVWLTLEPEIAIGSAGSRLYFVNAGIDIQF